MNSYIQSSKTGLQYYTDSNINRKTRGKMKVKIPWAHI